MVFLCYISVLYFMVICLKLVSHVEIEETILSLLYFMFITTTEFTIKKKGVFGRELQAHLFQNITPFWILFCGPHINESVISCKYILSTAFWSMERLAQYYLEKINFHLQYLTWCHLITFRTKLNMSVEKIVKVSTLNVKVVNEYSGSAWSETACIFD